MQAVQQTDHDLDNALHAWAAWMRSDSVDHGFPRSSVGIRWNPGRDFDDLTATADGVLARAADAVIDDLPARLRAAVSVRQLGCRWMGDPDGLLHALVEAREALVAGLRRRRVL